MFPVYKFGVADQNRSKKLSFINEQDLFKLAAINLPRHALLHAMPVSMQVDSTEVNRLRSHYIKIIVAVWRLYCKQLFGRTCPVFGSFTKDGELIPSPELADWCQLECEERPDIEKYPAINFAVLAKDARTTETVVA